VQWLEAKVARGAARRSLNTHPPPHVTTATERFRQKLQVRRSVLVMKQAGSVLGFSPEAGPSARRELSLGGAKGEEVSDIELVAVEGRRSGLREGGNMSYTTELIGPPSIPF
jgi:hypothetical protein